MCLGTKGLGYQWDLLPSSNVQQTLGFSHPGLLVSLIGLGNYPQDPSGYGPTRPSQSYGQAEQGYSAGPAISSTARKRTILSEEILAKWQKSSKRRNEPSGNSPTGVLTWTSSWTCPSEYPSCSTQLVPLRTSLHWVGLGRSVRLAVLSLHQQALLKRLRKAKKEAPPMEKPDVVKTHLRDMVILPEMVGSMVGVYNGKTFNQVEIKPEMIGHYLGEFSITYKPVKHGRPGIGATHSSRFIPLK
ncbi:RS15 protein, partial [Polyodon spathula]|nr:RS15 protein [Polyodon spathula]